LAAGLRTDRLGSLSAPHRPTRGSSIAAWDGKGEGRKGKDKKRKGMEWGEEKRRWEKEV